jgi:hypothetical protein
MSDIWNINKQNAQIKADNEAASKPADYINMVNRVRREQEAATKTRFDKQTAEVHRQAVEAEKAFKKSIHSDVHSDIEALFQKRDDLSQDQINGNYRKYVSMVLNGQSKDINVNDINDMMRAYIDVLMVVAINSVYMIFMLRMLTEQ